MADPDAPRDFRVRDEIGRLLLDSVASVEDAIDTRWRRLRRRLGWTGRPQIVPYVGYANDRRLWVHGRVLTNPPRELPDPDDSWWDNIAQTYTRFGSDEVPDVSVEITVGPTQQTVTTDEEGYFHLESSRDPDEVCSAGRENWTAATMRIVDHPDVAADASIVLGRILTPPPSATLGVISDVDDTILHTDVLNIKAMARHTFFHNARMRLPLAGVASLYQAFQRAGRQPGESPNPIWYVSSSPWNLHDLLEDFLDLNDIPDGPLLLRDFGLNRGPKPKGHRHKLEKALTILADFPALPFVLMGDSGQQDATLYAEAAAAHPEQVRAVLIRDVDPDRVSRHDEKVIAAIEQAKQVGVPMHLVRDSVEAARIAIDLGLIDAGELPAIEAATRKR